MTVNSTGEPKPKAETLTAGLPTAEETKALPPDGGPKYNRLVFEKSPYLLQHATNPVDWYPWGDEAFVKALAEDRAVFLSIGYATCHWCHVMAHESFEDPQVAQLLNEHFVAVKVDREERPDVDHVYMTVCQALTGSGGWPLTVILTPDRRPFFAGTYFPRTGAYGRIGMMELLPKLLSVWTDRREEAMASATQIVDLVRQVTAGAPGPPVDEEVLGSAFNELSLDYDARHGGFGIAPKFPTPHTLCFLLRYHHRTGDENALRMVEKTLSAMRLGGIFDHVGFGFHRYSTDRRWLVPHFEKMLYDQALLAQAYLEAYQATGREEFAATAREIFAYVLRDMTSPEGGFYSAEDADSEGEEGRIYVWRPQEITEILGKEEGELFNRVFNVREGGNVRGEASGLANGASICHLEAPLSALAPGLGMAPEALAARIERSRCKLFAFRESRVHPLKDDKVLTDWNGLMISALALGYAVLGDPTYLAAAKKALAFVKTHLTGEQGRLAKRHRLGETAGQAHLEDYAFVIQACLDLWEADFDTACLDQARKLNRVMMARFWDSDRGGLFQTADDGETLIVRAKDFHDGAIPSGNAVAALNCLRLGRLTADEGLAERVWAIARAFSGELAKRPSGFTALLGALDFAWGPSAEVVIVGRRGATGTEAMLKALRERFYPRKVVLLRPAGEDGAELARLAPYTKGMTAADGTATAYVCKGYVCKAPATDPVQMLSLLE